MKLNLTNINASNIPRVLKKFETLEQKFHEQHKNKFDYSKAIYENVDKKIIIVCPIHGDFEQSPYLHLKSEFGCPCCVEENKRGKTYSTKEFIEKAKLIHGTKYDYSNTVYVRNKIKITVICSKHGKFEQTPADHLQGCGCQTCAIVNIHKKYFMKSTILYYVYIEKANLYKIGITTHQNPLKRFSKERKLGITLLWSEKFNNGKDAYLKEQEIIKKYKIYKYNGKPFFSRGGESECFTIDILQKGNSNEFKRNSNN